MKSCITLGTFSVFLSTAAQENLSRLPESEIALLRADIQIKETDILQQNLALSDERAKKFWFVQRSYENDLLKLGDKRLDVVREYTNWDNLNDATARDSGKGPLKYQKKRVWIFVPGTPTGCQKRYRPLSRQNSSTDPAIICTSFRMTEHAEVIFCSAAGRICAFRSNARVTTTSLCRKRRIS